jgi:hypothetical protein
LVTLHIVDGMDRLVLLVGVLSLDFALEDDDQGFPGCRDHVLVDGA